jgi:hypothetical protein
MEMSGQLHAPSALPPGKEALGPIGQEAGLAPEPVWTLWRREKFCSYRDLISDSSAVQLVTIRYADWAIAAHFEAASKDIFERMKKREAVT